MAATDLGLPLKKTFCVYLFLSASISVSGSSCGVVIAEKGVVGVLMRCDVDF